MATVMPTAASMVPRKRKCEEESRYFQPTTEDIESSDQSSPKRRALGMIGDTITQRQTNALHTPLHTRRPKTAPFDVRTGTPRHEYQGNEQKTKLKPGSIGAFRPHDTLQNERPGKQQQPKSLTIQRRISDSLSAGTRRSEQEILSNRAASGRNVVHPAFCKDYSHTTSSQMKPARARMDRKQRQAESQDQQEGGSVKINRSVESLRHPYPVPKSQREQRRTSPVQINNDDGNRASASWHQDFEGDENHHTAIDEHKITASSTSHAQDQHTDARDNEVVDIRAALIDGLDDINSESIKADDSLRRTGKPGETSALARLTERRRAQEGNGKSYSSQAPQTRSDKHPIRPPQDNDSEDELAGGTTVKSGLVSQVARMSPSRPARRQAMRDNVNATMITLSDRTSAPPRPSRHNTDNRDTIHRRPAVMSIQLQSSPSSASSKDKLVTPSRDDGPGQTPPESMDNNKTHSRPRPSERISAARSSQLSRPTYTHLIGLQGYIAREYCAIDSTLQLGWNDNANAYELTLNGRPQRSTTSRSVVYISGKQFVRLELYSGRNRTVAKLVPQISVDGAQKQTLVCFTDISGAAKCLRQLQNSSEGSAYVKEMNNNSLEKEWEAAVHKITAEHTFTPPRPLKSPEAREHHYSAGIEITEKPLKLRDRMQKHQHTELIEDDGAVQASIELRRSSRRTSTRGSGRLDSTARSPVPIERWTEIHKPEPWSEPVVYPANPPPGVQQEIIPFSLLPQLDEGQELNDLLVGFGLRRSAHLISSQFKVDFFLTHFYNKLTGGRGLKGYDYKGVRKWTKNTDLLMNDFVVVPINQHHHWYAAIICNLPKLIGAQSLPMLLPDDVGEASQDLDGLTLSEEAATAGEDVDHQSQVDANTPKLPKRKKSRGGAIRAYSPSDPVIIFMDSMGFARTEEAKVLKQYIVDYARDTRQLELETAQIQGINAKGLPQQPNSYDCGVYLIAYLAAFTSDPRGFVNKILSRKMDYAVDFPNQPPETYRKVIRDDLFSLYEQQEADRQAKKREIQAALETEQAAKLGEATKTGPCAVESIELV